jgi:hypothetical protein
LTTSADALSTVGFLNSSSISGTNNSAVATIVRYSAHRRRCS